MSDKEMRTLDAYIAEHVMGWKKLKKPFNITANTFFYCGGGSEVLVHHQANQLKCFHPTTDRAAAMEVLEKLLEKVATRSMEIYQGAHEGPEFRPCFCVTMEGMTEVAIADTLPLAICLFARELHETKT